MSIFAKLFKSISSSKSKESSSHRLGSNNDATAQNLIDIVFTCKSLGFEVTQWEDCVVKVAKVVSGTESHEKGVQIGDIVISVDGNSVTTPDELAAVLNILDRPVTLR